MRIALHEAYGYHRVSFIRHMAICGDIFDVFIKSCLRLHLKFDTSRVVIVGSLTQKLLLHARINTNFDDRASFTAMFYRLTTFVFLSDRISAN